MGRLYCNVLFVLFLDIETIDIIHNWQKIILQ